MNAARWLLLAAGLSLLAVLAFWYLPGRPLAFLFLGLPLAVVLPGALRAGRLALALGGFLALLYLAHALMELTANPAARGSALLEALCALLLLTGCSLLLRWRPGVRISPAAARSSRKEW